MPKKPPRNNFYYFMQDFKKREEDKGRTFANMQDVATAAGVEWREMNGEQRKPYTDKAKSLKKGDDSAKYTTLGVDVRLVMKKQQEQETAINKMEAYIKNLVQDGMSFVSRDFYVAHVNHYCHCNRLSKHLPAEISIVRFNIKEGIDRDDIFHVILDIGTLPVGYLLAVTKNSEETHQIPPPPHEGDVAEMSEKNLKKVVESMLEYLSKNINQSDPLPPIYVDDENIEMAKDIFKHLLYDANFEENMIKVYSLSYLYFVLRNAAHANVSKDTAFPFPSIAQADLERDVYDYVKHISCEFHEITDAYQHCSMSKAIRRIFSMCDNICSDLRITMVPGRHIPLNSNIAKLETSSSESPVPVQTTTSTSRPESSLSSYSSTNMSSRSSSKTSYSSVTRPAATARLPRTSSIVQGANSSNANDDYNMDFPALGGTQKPFVMGRGRGRILNMNNAFSKN